MVILDHLLYISDDDSEDSGLLTGGCKLACCVGSSIERKNISNI